MFAMAAQPPPMKHRPKSVTDLVVPGEEATNKSEEDLIRMIKAFRYLSRNNKTDAKKESLLLNEASAALALARLYRLKKDDKTYRPQEEKYLKMALEDAQEVLKIANIDNKTAARAAYYAGLANLNLTDGSHAEPFFLKAVHDSPNSEFVPGISLLVAEMKFDHEKYQEAIDYYKMFFARLNTGQKAIAIYKTAWCLVNLQKYEFAEKNFLRLAESPKPTSFTQDAKKDLSYLLSTRLDDAGVIAYGNREIKNDNLRKEILTEVYRFFQAQSGTVRHPVLFNEIMRVETDPGNKLVLLISNLRAQQKPYASVEPYREFLEIRKAMSEWKVGKDSKPFAKVSAELDVELRSLIRSYQETFSGTVKTAEKLTKKDIGEKLIVALSFYAQYYPNSTEIGPIYVAWMNTCLEIQNYQCTLDVSSYLMKQKSVSPEVRRTAWLNSFKALEVLQKTEPKYRTEFVDSLAKFCGQEKEDKEWLPLAKRLTALLNEDKKFEPSLKWLDQIHEKERSSESLYRLMWTAFQAGEFKRLTSYDGGFLEDKFGKDTKELVREAHLRMAQQASEQKHFDEYESHIKGYFALNPPAEKKDLVERDYFLQLLDRGSWMNVEKSFIEMPAAQRSKKSLEPAVLRLNDSLIMNGQFDNLKLIDEGNLSDEVRDNVLLARIASGHALTKEDSVAIFHSKLREYILSVLTLTEPDSMIVFENYIRNLSQKELRMLLIAHQAKQGRADVELDAHAQRALASILPEDLKPAALTNTEKQALAIQFPKGKQAAALLTKKIPAIAAKVRELRQPFIAEINGKTAKVQRRILGTATDLEQKVSALILSSPVPAGLAADKVEEYKASVATLAKEFSDQSEEYKKLLATIEEKSGSVPEDKKAIYGFDLSDWDVSDGPESHPLNSMISQGKFAGAIFALDRWKQAGLKPEDYYAWRVKILLSHLNSPFMKEYVYNELETAKMDGLIKKWRKKR